jgi:hypothetical protein
MNIEKKDFSTDEEYTNFVRHFVSLLDKQMNMWEEKAKDGKNLTDLVNQMPLIISLVNVVGCLRGQDNVFSDIRPPSRNQKEFYNYEDYFEKRLGNLIDIIMSSEAKDYYKHVLEKDLVKRRSE